jgi:uncharacterized hydrophobic protein (TIGR00341 family)
MSLRLVEIISDTASAKQAVEIAKKHGAHSVHYGATNEEGRRRTTVLIGLEDQQAFLDALQNDFGKGSDWRIVLTPVEAAIPDPEKERREKEKAEREAAEAAGREPDAIIEAERKVRERKALMATREELYNEIAGGTKLDQNFLMLVLLSAVVAAIGLLGNNVAVVIGAMVIAPLLGPNLALAFAAALGDRELMSTALKTNAAGLGLTLVLTTVIGLLFANGSLDNPEILTRTEVNLSAIVLALASGAAAVLSITTGLSATLVGVMVAVALMPPAAVVGLTLGAGRPDLTAGAAILLAVNIASVNLAAQLVLLVKGFRPRTWLERHSAKQSMKWTIAIWGGMLVALTGLILLLQTLNSLNITE